MSEEESTEKQYWYYQSCPVILCNRRKIIKRPMEIQRTLKIVGSQGSGCCSIRWRLLKLLPMFGVQLGPF